MQPRFLRSLFFLLFLNLLIKPLWLLGIDRNVQNATGSASYGLYYVLFSMSFYLQILLDPGLHTHNNQSLAREPERLSANLSQFLPLKLLLSAAYLLLTILTGFIAGYSSAEVQMLAFISLFQIFSSLILFMRSFLTGLHLFNTDSLFSVLDRCLMILFGAVLLWGGLGHGPFNISWYVYAQVGATSLAAIAAGWVIFSKAEYFRPGINFPAFLKIIRQSYPFAILGILMTLYSRVDSVMIERMLPGGSVQAGIYAQAYRLLEAANMIAFLFSTILLPVFTGMIHRREPIGPAVLLPSRLLLIPAFLLVLGCFFFRAPLMHKLYSQADAESSAVFGWLLLTFLPISGIYIYGTLLTAAGNLRFLNITAFLGVAANVLLNLWLIPRFKVQGAVAATLITQTLVCIAHLTRAHKLFQLRLKKKDAVMGSLFVLIAVSSFVFLHDWKGNWMVNLLLLTVINLTFAVLLGLLKPKYFTDLLKLKSE